MSEVHFQKIIKGASLVFIGTIISLLVGFLSKIVFIRNTTQTEYGIFSLAFTISSILIVVATLGLDNGSSRYIAYFKGKNEVNNIQKTILYSFVIVFFSSAVIFLITFFLSEYISANIFEYRELTLILKLLSITIPLTVFINMVVAIFRGYSITSIKIYFGDIIRPFSYLMLLILAILLDLSFEGLVYSYVLSITVTFLLLLLYCVNVIKKKREIIKLSSITRKKDAADMIKSLIVFSVPLLSTSILLSIMTWTDTLMIGYFRLPEEIALYNAAYTIASLLSVIINSLGFIYLPVIAELYGKNDIKELKNAYNTTTKLCFTFTYPLFFGIIIFPEIILNTFFGTAYTNAAIPLQILASGFIFNSYFGLNYHTLITIGKSKFLMYCSLIGATLNIILNILLIPTMGIVGAALASISSFLLIEILMTKTLHAIATIHPFNSNYIKVTLLSIVNVILFLCVKQYFEISTWFSPIIYLSSLILYYISIYYTNSYDQEELNIIKETIMKMSGK